MRMGRKTDAENLSVLASKGEAICLSAVDRSSGRRTGQQELFASSNAPMKHSGSVICGSRFFLNFVRFILTRVSRNCYVESTLRTKQS